MFDKYQLSGAYHWRQTDRSWYNSEFNPPLVARYEALMKMLPHQAQTILDVGCGDGYLIYLASCKHAHIHLYGVDEDTLAVNLAKEELKKHNCKSSIYCANVYHLPFQSTSFDAVLMADVIEHLDEQDRALKEVCRILRDDGILLLTTPNRQPYMKWDKLHVREYNAYELKILLKKYFSNVQVTSCWPMWWVHHYKAGGIKRQLINALCRIGYNPFLKNASSPTVDYGQLIARCMK
ncbi:hypothetical protein BEH94_05955 [Candidatus Altiarchaeales archaeon WOR_SM1_SCG]|nr:hypothetical protein BEH94_05955 [Candidatus Altiarchaeales archaeon WOR_SM1_SCG]